MSNPDPFGPTFRWAALVVVFLLGLSSQTGSAQTSSEGRIAGRVVDATTNAPLPGATIQFEDVPDRRGTSTGEEGRFSLTAVSSGAVTLQIRHVGYAPKTRTVQVEAGETTNLSVALRREPVSLSVLEVTGLAGEARTSFPGAASRVDVAELEQIDPIGAQEALTHVPGVVGLSDDGMGQTRMSVGIRGLQPRRTQRVLVLEDGLPIQPAPYVFSPLYYNPPTERIEEIEVIKGSASIRHGPQTMAGVINYITSRPTRQRPGGTLEVTSGTHGYVSTFLEAGGFGSQSVRPQVQFLFKRGNGYRKNNDFRQLNGTAKLQYDIGDDRSLYLKANVNYERLNATYTGVTPYTLRTDPAFNPKEHDFYRIFRASLGAIYNHQYGDDLQGTTKFYANGFDRPWWRENDVFVRASDYEQNGADADPVPPSTPGPLIRVGVSDVVDGPLTAPYFGNERTFYVGGVEQSFEFEHGVFGHAATLEAGGRLHWERFKDVRRISDEVGVREGVTYRGDPSNPESVEIVGENTTYETTALALYAQEEVQWGSLRLTPGLRLEAFEQERIDRLQGALYRDETSVVPLPSLGVNVDLGTVGLGPTIGEGQIHLFGGVHRGYTPPSSATFQIVGFGDPEAVSDGGDSFDLRAEKSWNSEVGVRGRSEAGRVEVTGFYLYVEDLVGGRTRFQKNLGVVQSYGLEMQTTLDAGVLGAPLPTVDGSYTFLQTEVVEGVVSRALGTGQVDISGNELPGAPHHTATVGLSQTVPSLNLTLNADVRYVGWFYTDLENLESTSNRGERGPVPAHTVFDASASYAFSENLHVRFAAKNITDNVYIGSRLHSNPRDRSASGSTGILPGPRRQINLTIEYDF